jgi:hypothetical protein
MYLWLLSIACVAVLSASYVSGFLGSSLEHFASGLAQPGFTSTDPMRLKLALLNPTFTHAAYQNNSFYTFYTKYFPITSPGSIITTDHNLINNKKIPHGPFYVYNQLPGSSPGIPHKYLMDRVVDTISLLAPTSNLTVIDDEYVDAGQIFDSNGRNNLDVIFLVHEEYVTQNEYDNLKKFVTQGGTLVFVESNVLTVEVSYNRQNDSITLVKGHLFEFDGKVAKRNLVAERWKNETSQWLGSNFFPKPTYYTVYFKDMPFNYTHTEEQYISNPNAVILYDYKMFDPLDPGLVTVASYEMKYGEGKILMTSLFSTEIDTDREFFNFFKTVILPRAIGSVYKINLNGSSHDIYGLGYIPKGQPSLQPNHEIIIPINRSTTGNRMILDIPRQLFALYISDQVKPTDVDYSVTIDNNNNRTRYNVTRFQNEIGFEVPINNDSRVIKISASLNPTPFTLSAPSELTIKAQGPLTKVSDLGKPTIQPRMDPMPIIRNDAPAKFPLGLTAVKWTASDASGHNASDIQIVKIVDKNYPTISITYPKDRTVVPVSGDTVIIKGTAFDDVGVKVVDIDASSEFTKKEIIYHSVLPIKTGNWSSWSMPLDIRELTNPILLTARVTDVAGHQRWAHAAFVAKSSNNIN